MYHLHKNIIFNNTLIPLYLGVQSVILFHYDIKYKNNANNTKNYYVIVYYYIYILAICIIDLCYF